MKLLIPIMGLTAALAPVNAQTTAADQAVLNDNSAGQDMGLNFPSPISKVQSISLFVPESKTKEFWANYMDEKQMEYNVDEYLGDKEVAMPFILGVLLADGFFSVKAQDPERLSNISDQIKVLATQLGATSADIRKANEMVEYASSGKWGRVIMELNYLRFYIVRRLQKNDSCALIMAGAWIQGANYVTGVVSDAGNESGSMILREPRLVGGLLELIEADGKESPFVDKISTLLKGAKETVNVEIRGTVPLDQVAALETNLSALISDSVEELKTK